MAELTQLLQQVQAGDMSARDALFAATYPTLEMRARARLRDGGRNTLLDTRGVVHESYLRYVQGGTLRAEDRRAFFAFVSTAEVAHLHYSEQEIAETLEVTERTVQRLWLKAKLMLQAMMAA